MRMVWWLATLAAMNTLTAGAMLADVVGTKVAGMGALLVASLQTGTAVYQQALREHGYRGGHRA